MRVERWFPSQVWTSRPQFLILKIAIQLKQAVKKVIRAHRFDDFSVQPLRALRLCGRNRDYANLGGSALQRMIYRGGRGGYAEVRRENPNTKEALPIRGWYCQ
jgi:hypothetical protein